MSLETNLRQAIVSVKASKRDTDSHHKRCRPGADAPLLALCAILLAFDTHLLPPLLGPRLRLGPRRSSGCYSKSSCRDHAGQWPLLAFLNTSNCCPLIPCPPSDRSHLTRQARDSNSSSTNDDNNNNNVSFLHIFPS